MTTNETTVTVPAEEYRRSSADADLVFVIEHAGYFSPHDPVGEHEVFATTVTGELMDGTRFSVTVYQKTADMGKALSRAVCKATEKFPSAVRLTAHKPTFLI